MISRNLIARIVVALVFIPVILYVSMLGGVWLFSFLLLLAAVGTSEFLAREGHSPKQLSFWGTLATTLLFFQAIAGFNLPDVAIGNTLLSTQPLLAGCVLLFGYVLVFGMYFAMRRGEPATLFSQYVRLVWGILYLGGLYGIVFRLGEGMGRIQGMDAILLLFVTIWVGDTAAMWGGKQFGKHLLAPSVSPGKTVEGFFLGIVGAVGAAVALHVFVLKGELPLVHLIAMAAGSSVCGQLGDLVESLWKRSIGAKDSSHLIPGHGGVLDRFDSLLFAAPFMLAYLFILGQ